MLNEKIGIGTVQFGLNYGINNSEGQVSPVEVSGILELSKKNKISTLDTAYLYGNSEEVLGQNGLGNFNIVTKIPDCKAEEIPSKFEESLQRLKQQKIYGLLFHMVSTYFKNTDAWQFLSGIKASGKVKKIGFSLYSAEDLEKILDQGIVPDLVQVPYNIFDRNFEKIFPQLKAMNVEVHTRSAFLQGLLLMDPKKLPEQFAPVKEKLEHLHEKAASFDLSATELCLHFVLTNPDVDKLIMGVDGVKHLQQNLDSLKKIAACTFDRNELECFTHNDKNIIDPSTWNKK